ncbi:EF-hand domain-containing protein [Aestuariivirga sp.]|uniref:EF-hand domain-containing protein n=1 Tax=Aestuariivirga sp. TaxID=2650926 RepID=UPI003BA90C02
MQRRLKLVAATATAAMLTLGAGLAHADRGDGDMCGMRHGPGPMGRQLVERYDANKDGTVTQQEIDQNRTQWLADFDADKNGMLSLDEFKLLWLKARNEMMVREFQFFDRDGNGQVTLDEYQLPAADLASRGDGPPGRDGRGPGPRWRHGPGMDHGMDRGMDHGRPRVMALAPCAGNDDGPPPPPPGDQPPPPPGDGDSNP